MKRKLGLLAVVAVVVGSICLAGCQSAPSGTAIQPGSAEDPFKGTSWAASVTIVFGNDGTVNVGNLVPYAVTKTDAAYVATMRGGFGFRYSLSIENENADTGSFTANGMKVTVSRIR